MGATAESAPAARRAGSTQRQQARRVAVKAPAAVETRHFRQTVTKIDLWSVVKVALCFYLALVLVGIVALIALWVIAESVGIVDNVEKFMRELLGTKTFTFLSFTMLRGVVLVGLVFVALATSMTVIAAAFYNVFADLLGGVEVTITEEHPPGR